MWPSQRSQDNLNDSLPEIPAEVKEEEVLARGVSSRSSRSSLRSGSSMICASSGLTRREQARLLKKQKEEEERMQKEAAQRKKKADAKKRREAAKKTSKKKKKKKVCKPAEIEVGDVVLVSKGIAVTRWKGTLHFRPDDGMWLGVEFVDGPFGKNDGKIRGKRYFKTKKKDHGSFVKQITRKLKPEDLLRKLGETQSKLKSRQEALESAHAAICDHKERQLEKAFSPDVGNLKTPLSSLNLLDSLSGNLEAYAQGSAGSKDIQLNLHESDSSSEDYYTDSEDEEFDEEEYQRRKGERKNLLLASQTDLYREGSLRKMQEQMQEQMDNLKTRGSNPKPKITKQKTMSNMSLVLPEKNATPEEVGQWIKENLSKIPGHPDLDDENIMQSLTWTLGLFLKVQDNFSF